MGQDTVKIGQDQIVKKGHFLPFRFFSGFDSPNRNCRQD